MIERNYTGLSPAAYNTTLAEPYGNQWTRKVKRLSVPRKATARTRMDKAPVLLRASGKGAGDAFNANALEAQINLEYQRHLAFIRIR